MTITIVSGGFDPIHVGHVRMIREAAAIGDQLIVGVNSDDWLLRKKGKVFMPFKERTEVIMGIKGVKKVVGFNDDDNTACELLKFVRLMRPDDNLIFCNGGDRVKGNTPEDKMAHKLRIQMAYGVGGNDKAQSSSVLLAKWVGH